MRNTFALSMIGNEGLPIEGDGEVIPDDPALLG